MTYIDGFVAAVPTANKEKYTEHASAAWPLFEKLGATGMVECWEDNVPEGEITSFTMAVQRKEDESIIFSWITWPSKEVRDAAWKEMMDNPDMEKMADMPFDGKRMIYGGFMPIVEKQA